jgi:hypothetical protein
MDGCVDDGTGVHFDKARAVAASEACHGHELDEPWAMCNVVVDTSDPRLGDQ